MFKVNILCTSFWNPQEHFFKNIHIKIFRLYIRRTKTISGESKCGFKFKIYTNLHIYKQTFVLLTVQGEVTLSV
jgi:hypothetical protein